MRRSFDPGFEGRFAGPNSKTNAFKYTSAVILLAWYKPSPLHCHGGAVDFSNVRSPELEIQNICREKLVGLWGIVYLLPAILGRRKKPARLPVPETAAGQNDKPREPPQNTLIKLMSQALLIHRWQSSTCGHIRTRPRLTQSPPEAGKVQDKKPKRFHLPLASRLHTCESCGLNKKLKTRLCVLVMEGWITWMLVRM
jgi:hypothetical protein